MMTSLFMLVTAALLPSVAPSAVAAPHAAHCARGDATFRLEPWGVNSIRVRFGTDPTVEMKQQALLPQTAGKVATSASPPVCDPVTSGDLRAEIDPGSGKLVFTRVASGERVLEELELSACAAGSCEGWATFKSTGSERLYGLGEHRTGRLDNHGISIDFMDAGVYDHHQGSDIVLPFYLSNRGYGFLWNHASFGAFNSTDEYVRWDTMDAPLLDFWVTVPSAAAADPFKQLLGQFGDATGKPPAMPSFATGFWQCKNRYRTQEELLAAARGYKERELPISVIVIDYLHWRHFGDFALDPRCWPDPAAMVAELESLDIRVMVSIWPFVQSADVYGPDYNASGPSVNFQPMLDGDMLVKDAATGKQAPVFRAPFWQPTAWENASSMYIMDPYNPKTRSFVFEQLRANYMAYGIKTFWLDEAEPERHVQDIGIRFGYHDGTDAQVGLAWSRVEQQMVWEGLQQSGLPQDDIFMLSRSFFTGGARYGAGAWSGDIPSTFDSLREQVRVGQNVAVSGIYWWTTDVSLLRPSPACVALPWRASPCRTCRPAARARVQSAHPLSRRCGGSSADWRLLRRLE